MIGWILAMLVIVGLFAIGVAGVLAPRPASVQYGIGVGDARSLAFIRAMAVRDLVIGGLLGMIALVATRQALGWAMCLTTFIAVVDLLVVMADRSASSRAWMDRATILHGGGAVGLLIAGGLLLTGY